MRVFSYFTDSFQHKIHRIHSKLILISKVHSAWRTKMRSVSVNTVYLYHEGQKVRILFLNYSVKNLVQSIKKQIKSHQTKLASIRNTCLELDLEVCGLNLISKSDSLSNMVSVWKYRCVPNGIKFASTQTFFSNEYKHAWIWIKRL